MGIDFAYACWPTWPIGEEAPTCCPLHEYSTKSSGMLSSYPKALDFPKQASVLWNSLPWRQLTSLFGDSLPEHIPEYAVAAGE